MSLGNVISHENIVTVPYVAGRLKQFVSVWQTITSDHFILSAVKGVKFEFANFPQQSVIPRKYNFNFTEVDIIDNQIEKLPATGVF